MKLKRRPHSNMRPLSFYKTLIRNSGTNIPDNTNAIMIINSSSIITLLVTLRILT
nr:MAG TPA: hypothetical protein [Caudoviricetes sp.]